MTEAILDPELPIIDPHHHLWDLKPLLASRAPGEHPFSDIYTQSPQYLFEHLLADTQSGHNIVSTVFMECSAFYNADAPDELKPAGEVEYVNGVAARSASGLYGNFRACAGIVGHANLLLGDKVAPVLEALIAAGNGRFRGIRHSASYDADTRVLGPLVRAPAKLYRDPVFRQGFAHLAHHGLSFDAWIIEPQIPDVTDLARAFPETPIVLDHVGTPLGLGQYAGTHDERFPIWKQSMKELASCPNAFVKLGGLAMPFCGFPGMGPDHRPDSETLAKHWQPYIETSIELFGPERAMFESNFPVDRWGAEFSTLWNAFKRIAQGASDDEKRHLFSASAANFYRLKQP